ncbi:MAG: T9SS type A sorting domain-containing protein [Bacteroidetes bacterium]|nr:T9SS type A sorting domain-containing protein [Bacteroidota bacterium]
MGIKKAIKTKLTRIVIFPLLFSLAIFPLYSAGHFELMYDINYWKSLYEQPPNDTLGLFSIYVPPVVIKRFGNYIHMGAICKYYVHNDETDEMKVYETSDDGIPCTRYSSLSGEFIRDYTTTNDFILQTSRYLMSVKIINDSTPIFFNYITPNDLTNPNGYDYYSFKGIIHLGYVYYLGDTSIKKTNTFYNGIHEDIPFPSSGLRLNRERNESYIYGRYVGKLLNFSGEGGELLFLSTQSGAADTIDGFTARPNDYPANFPVKILAYNVNTRNWHFISDDSNFPVKLANPTDNRYGYTVDYIFSNSRIDTYKTFFAVSSPTEEAYNNVIISCHYNMLAGEITLTFDTINIPISEFFPNTKARICKIYYIGNFNEPHTKNKVLITFKNDWLENNMVMEVENSFLLLDLETKEYELVTSPILYYGERHLSSIKSAERGKDNVIWLAIGTYIYKYYSDFLLGIQEEPTKTFNSVELFPNPTDATTTLILELLSAGNLKITLEDLLGIELLELHNTFEDTGKFATTFSLETFPTGVYLLKINHNGNVKMEKVIRN